MYNILVSFVQGMMKMLEFEEYKQKLNALKPTLDGLRDALRLEAAEKEIEELEG